MPPRIFSPAQATAHPVGSHAHNTLIEQARQNKACAAQLLNEGSRDYAVLREFIERYIAHQSAADLISK